MIGIDEAGRGPLAGPVAVGVVALPRGFDMRLLQGVRDSKKMSELGREMWFEKLHHFALERGVRWNVQFASALYIDTYGIVPAVRRAMARALNTLGVEEQGVRILLDGSLKAPARFATQKTIIGGDDLEPVISLASVAAKVRRDRLMLRYARAYPEYHFDEHKGYGTKDHYAALKKYGFCDIHRRTFCGVEK